MDEARCFGAYRDYGPWTDLYALGCVANKLATGLPPFPHENFMQLMYAHLHKAPPPMVPRRPVAPGFEAWVQRLLEKKPGLRFQRAADAALALRVTSVAILHEGDPTALLLLVERLLIGHRRAALGAGRLLRDARHRGVPRLRATRCADHRGRVGVGIWCASAGR